MKSEETSIQKKQQPLDLEAVDVLTKVNSLGKCCRGKPERRALPVSAHRWLSTSEVPHGTVVIR